MIIDKTLRALTGVEAYHSRGYDGRGVTVAVVDTGVYPHPDLKDSLLPGWAKGRLSPTEDSRGHGTMVAHVIRQLAPGAKIIPVRNTNTNGALSTQYTQEGLRWLREQRPDVVNLSFVLIGGRDAIGEEQVNALVDSNTHVCIAAGNTGEEDHLGYSYMDRPIIVGAVDASTRMASFSTHHDQVDVVQYGCSIMLGDNTGGKRKVSGTSFASPAIAGMMACIRSRTLQEGREPDEAAEYAELMHYARDALVVCKDGKHNVPYVCFTGKPFYQYEGEKEIMPETKYIQCSKPTNALVVRDVPKGDKVGTIKHGKPVLVLQEDGSHSKVVYGDGQSYLDGRVTAGSLVQKAPAVEPETDLSAALRAWGFHPDNRNAVKHFQAAMGLQADGIAGPKTWAALNGEKIVPRITERDMLCQCQKHCNGSPNVDTTGVRIFIERLWMKLEKEYPGVQLCVANREHPTPDKAIAGGQRCREWNRERGGAANSQHLYGTAADVYARLDGVKDSVLRQRLEELALDMNVRGGVGYGARYIVHVDVRGKKARWKY